MHSSLYRGWVRHRRLGNGGHRFRYRLFMMYLDLAEVPGVFDGHPLWSARRPAPAWFRRADYLGPVELSLDEAVRRRVETETGRRPGGPIRMLAHLRYFGYCMNPVTFYYCFDRDGTSLEFIVAEINNTPWDERHAYVLDASAAPAAHGVHRFGFGKAFHVSPFLPMDMDYEWRFAVPGAGLAVHMENFREGQRVFDATLELQREPITSATLTRALLAYPFMTLKVVAMIYWQALRLWLRRTPFFDHPPGGTGTAPPDGRSTAG
jgi:DUF1365 family protein